MVIFLSVFHINAQNGMDFIETDDHVKLYVKESGDGPVCIFIHGGPGAWSKSFEDLRGNNLEQGLKMIYFDQRGSGRSEEATNDNYSLDRMIDDIEQIRLHLKVDKVYLLPHSFGGILAVNYALKYPQHVTGIIFANSTLDLLYSINQQTNYINELLGTNFMTPSRDSIIQTFLKANNSLQAKGLIYKKLSDNKQNVERVDSIDHTNPSKYEFAQKALFIEDYMQDFTITTPKIKCPVLIITGKNDRAIGVNHYKSFKFPNKKVVIIDGGHILYYEKNDEFIKSILSFVDMIENE